MKDGSSAAYGKVNSILGRWAGPVVSERLTLISGLLVFLVFGGPELRKKNLELLASFLSFVDVIYIQYIFLYYQ